MFKKKNGQSTLEYAVLIVVIVAALVALKIYMERGVQGKLRGSVDQIGEQFSASNTTYKISTEQIGNMTTKESFGFNETGGEAQGISYYKVVEPKPTTRKTDVEEKIDKTVEEEVLFE